MTEPFVLKWDQILVLVAKDFKLKYNATALGFAWSLIVPLLTSVIYYFVFGIICRSTLCRHIFENIIIIINFKSISS